MASQMTAAVLTGLRDMEVRRVKRPQITTDHDVLLRMEAVGVCGSDVHYYTTGRIGSQVVKYPFVVGHEGAASVAAVGTAVSRVKPGDRVAIEPAISCHACDQCRSGRPHTCRHLRFLGCPGQVDGCLSEYLVMPDECCFPLPTEMSYEDAALCEPLAIALYAVQQSVPMFGASVAILGLGPIGLSVLTVARAARARAIYASDPLPYRGRIAAAHGADWVGNPARVDIVQAVSAAEPDGVEVVFECCGQQDALDQGMRLLKPGGKLMLIGIPEFERFSFSADVMRRRELCLQNVRRQNDCVQNAIDGVRLSRFKPQFMITHRMGLDHCQEAFDLVANYRDGVVKAIIQFRQ
jgi:L-iditol 2-dehydrogenase